MSTDEAIVLVGGLGTRLRSIVSEVPKPLAPVAGRPFIAWVLDHLASAGIRRVILAVGYKGEMIEREIGARWAGMEVVYTMEDRPLGTGGAIRNAAARLAGDCTHVVNGDTYLSYAPAELEHLTRAASAAVGMALAYVPDVARYGAVSLADGKVVAFREKGEHGEGWINAGCYFLTSSALAALPDQPVYSFEEAVLSGLVPRGLIAGFTSTDGFIDIGVPEDYQRAQGLFGGNGHSA
jgi:D-glycero-alpha-D-manno-heptose 1-phosphate guanylyltransferase